MSFPASERRGRNVHGAHRTHVDDPPQHGAVGDGLVARQPIRRLAEARQDDHGVFGRCVVQRTYQAITVRWLRAVERVEAPRGTVAPRSSLRRVTVDICGRAGYGACSSTSSRTVCIGTFSTASASRWRPPPPCPTPLRSLFMGGRARRRWQGRCTWSRIQGVMP